MYIYIYTHMCVYMYVHIYIYISAGPAVSPTGRFWDQRIFVHSVHKFLFAFCFKIDDMTDMTILCNKQMCAEGHMYLHILPDLTGNYDMFIS